MDLLCGHCEQGGDAKRDSSRHCVRVKPEAHLVVTTVIDDKAPWSRYFGLNQKLQSSKGVKMMTNQDEEEHGDECGDKKECEEEKRRSWKCPDTIDDLAVLWHQTA